jgi:uncharacterized membrane protein YhdT
MRHRWAYWLLVVVVVVPLLVPLYDRMYPMLFGFPFYYWFQLAFIVFSMLAMTVIRLATKRRR